VFADFIPHLVIEESGCLTADRITMPRAALDHRANVESGWRYRGSRLEQPFAFV